MITKEFVISIYFTFLLIAFLALGILVSFFIIPKDILLSISGFFQSSGHDTHGCSLCGMTRAFIAISKGDYFEALSHNQWSVMVFGILVTIVFIALIVIMHPMRKKRFLHSIKLQFRIS